MTRPLIPFVQNGYYASRNWIPLVKGNGFTTSGGGEQEEVWETASGSIVTFDAIAAPLRQLSVAVEPVQSGTGDPSPTNVRPITGWDSVTVNRTGKNLYPNSDISGTAAGVTVTHNIADESYIVSGLSSAYRGFVASGSFTLKAGTYKISRTASSPSVSESGLRMEIRSVDGLVVYGYSNGSAFTLDSDTEVKSRIVVGLSGVDFGTGITYRFQIESGSSATAYEPYSGNEYTIQLGQTVYGGTLDVVNGKMTVDRAMVACTWGDFLYKSTLGSYARGSYDLPNRAVYPATAKTPQISNVAPFLANFTTDTLHFYCNNNQAICFLPVDTADSTEIQISYELATPFEIPLTPVQIATLQGTNNVWSDTGDVTVEYRAR